MGHARRVVLQTDTLGVRLAERAKELRARADDLAPGLAKDTLLELAQYAEISAHAGGRRRFSDPLRTEIALDRQDKNRFRRGEEVQLKRPYAKAITRKNRSPDWLTRKGIVQGFKPNFIYIQWDGRKTIEQVPTRAVEKVCAKHSHHCRRVER
ncbi:hypothetical protein SAMN05444164_8374 [Bradyrhizobium erythrophlei]|uniref:Uncharacterized protein n=1 Tax=Bradyrhizobium erythrophlei TaxID=1437360 RepID=A0A1H5JDL9_9BRAD|nr:hypothetical protein SAMN05444164_8374 [Bradyrhizobium erythrophlei]